MRRRFDFVRPKLLAIPSVKSPEAAVHGGADENQISRGCDTAAQVRRPSFQASGRELVKNAKRRPPGDVSGIDIDRNQLAPRCWGAGVACVGLPEPTSFWRDLAVGWTAGRQ